MIERKTGGSIINLTTIEAYRAAPGYAPYAAAKAGLANLTKTLALETAQAGITVNCISPGYVWTPLVEAQKATFLEFVKSTKF